MCGSVPSLLVTLVGCVTGFGAGCMGRGRMQFYCDHMSRLGSIADYYVTQVFMPHEATGFHSGIPPSKTTIASAHCMRNGAAAAACRRALRPGRRGSAEAQRGAARWGQEEPCVYVITFPTPYGCPKAQSLSKGWVFVIWCAPPPQGQSA
jgi:hypothetical protein